MERTRDDGSEESPLGAGTFWCSGPSGGGTESDEIGQTNQDQQERDILAQCLVCPPLQI